MMPDGRRGGGTQSAAGLLLTGTGAVVAWFSGWQMDGTVGVAHAARMRSRHQFRPLCPPRAISAPFGDAAEGTPA